MASLGVVFVVAIFLKIFSENKIKKNHFDEKYKITRKKIDSKTFLITIESSVCEYVLVSHADNIVCLNQDRQFQEDISGDFETAKVLEMIRKNQRKSRVA